MIIDLSTAKIGNITPYSGEVKLDDSILSREGEFLSSVKVKCDVVLISESEVAVMGTIEYGLRTPCDRCGVECCHEYSAKFSPSFSATPDEDGYKFGGQEIDLTKAVQDSVLLDIPTRIVCKDDCKGLCPICGKNLNDGKCKCKASEEESNNPFAALRQIEFNSGGAD